MGTPTGTQLQIATDSGFQSIVVDKSGGYSTTVQVSESDFSVAQPAGTTLYSRVKHIADTGASEWSDIVNFTIAQPWSSFTNNTTTFVAGGSVDGFNKVVALSATQSLAIFTYANQLGVILINYANSPGVTMSAMTGLHQLSLTRAIDTVHLLRISNTKALYLVNDYGFVLTVSGTTITAGAGVRFTTINVNNSTVDELSPGVAIVGITNDSSRYVVGINYGSGTLTYGSAVLLTSTAGSYSQIGTYVSKLTETQALVAYAHNGIYAFSWVTISGTAITRNTTKTISTSLGYGNMWFVVVSENYGIVVRNSTDYYGNTTYTATIVNISSTDVSFGNSLAIISGGMFYSKSDFIKVMNGTAMFTAFHTALPGMGPYPFTKYIVVRVDNGVLVSSQGTGMNNMAYQPDNFAIARVDDNRVVGFNNDSTSNTLWAHLIYNLA